mgnify:CR=1 FL=1
MTSINDLKSDHQNARKRTDRSAELIKESLQRYGAARSIVIDEDNRILAGNGTIEGAKEAGINRIRVIETDGDEVIAVRRKRSALPSPITALPISPSGIRRCLTVSASSTTSLCSSRRTI